MDDLKIYIHEIGFTREAGSQLFRLASFIDVFSQNIAYFPITVHKDANCERMVAVLRCDGSL